MIRALVIVLFAIVCSSCAEGPSQVRASALDEVSCTDMTFEGPGSAEDVRGAISPDGWRGTLAFEPCEARVPTPPRFQCAIPARDAPGGLRMTSVVSHRIDDATMIMARAGCQETEGAQWLDLRDDPHW